MSPDDKYTLGGKEPIQMTDKLKESLSAMMDNEADALESRRVLKHAQTNPEIDQAWDDYQLIGRVMRDGASAQVDLSAGIMAAIGQDNQVVEPAPVTPWYQRLGSQVAVAAGVAAAVLLGVTMNQQLTQPSFESQVAESTLVLPTQTNQLALPASTFGQTTRPEVPVNAALQSQLKAQIDAYLVRHAENAAATGGQGLLPLARVMRPQTEETN